MVDPYICLELTVPPDDRAIVYALLTLFPLTGIEEGEETLSVYFPAAQWSAIADDVQTLLQQHVPNLLDIRIEPLEAQDWYTKWLEQLSPLWLCEDLVVHPFPDPPQPQSYPGAKDVLHIVPGLAFGTGHHASTRLAAQLLLRVLRSGTIWIDAGTGSGILAILAARRGAQHVYAIDNNLYAVESAKLNVQRNNVAAQVTVIQADLEHFSFPTVHGIVANLHTELVIRLAPRIASSLLPGGFFVASGILTTYFTEVVEIYRLQSFSVLEWKTEGEWLGIIFQSFR